ncbi:hypothetical protein CPB84DRAFT_381718 [Gymnopilus junonius]|uniref:Uncharacterized protein n=1 Tax=Gymnopilus junonius TaxID=109634 RepID=A0A9P5TH25_GYMJU|nr:hypothetical protein CPB84DRAFT_381718 [Gymnopilus junonius]
MTNRAEHANDDPSCKTDHRYPRPLCRSTASKLNEKTYRAHQRPRSLLPSKGDVDLILHIRNIKRITRDTTARPRPHGLLLTQRTLQISRPRGAKQMNMDRTTMGWAMARRKNHENSDEGHRYRLPRPSPPATQTDVCICSTRPIAHLGVLCSCILML